MKTLARIIVLATIVAVAGANGAAQSFQDCVGQAPGCLDLSFGSGWVVTTIPPDLVPPHNASVTGIAVQNFSEGQRIVAVGNNYDRDYMVGYTTDGNIDSCFGDPVNCRAGYIRLPLAFAQAVAVQPSDNFVLVAGWIGGKTLQMAVARYTAAGLPDASFGIDGLAAVTFNTKPTSTSAAWDLAMQPDGKIVVVGSSGNSMAVVRLNVNGSMDTSFGSGGRFVTSLMDGASSVVLQPVPIAVNGVQTVDLMIVVASSAQPTYKGNAVPPRYNALLRLTSKGVVDASFGAGGLVMTDYLGYGGTFHDLVLDAENRLTAVGQAKTGTTWSDCCQLAVARYDISGKPDLTFNGNGKLLRAIQGARVYGNSVAIQADGKIRIAGSIDPNDSTQYRRAAIWRFNVDGSADTNWGNNFDHVESTLLGDGGGAAAFAQQTTTMFIVGGAYYSRGNADQFALARYFE